jgi:NitT/TauT family transport system substrate-binding protein
MTRTRPIERWTRRRFIGELGLVGTACALGQHPAGAAAEGPPETTRLRLAWTGSACQAPQYVAEDLLRAEGFADVQYVDLSEAGGAGVAQRLGAGHADMTMNFIGPLLIRLDAGDPIVLLAGGHVGCFELVGTELIRSIRDVKGRTVALNDRVTSYVFLDSLLGYVGLDPRKDINLVVHPASESMRLLSDRKVDAFLAFPPFAQELRAKKIGHVVASFATDRPWSQYFCCLLAGNREFVRRHPIATKRAIRAILKAADLCALEPDRGARVLTDKRYSRQYEYAVQLMKDLPYGKWREYDAEDTMRFYGLRLHEIGMIKSNPKKLIAQGTDWRFLNELRKELKS